MPKGIVKIFKSVYLAQIVDSSVEAQRHRRGFAELRHCDARKQMHC